MQFRIFLRGDGRSPTWYATPATQHSGDQWLIGVSSLSPNPVATPNTITRLNPGGTLLSAIPATAFAGTDAAPFVLSSLTLTTFPTNATSILINGTFYDATSFAAASAAARTLLTNANGNLAAGQSVSIDPSTGTASVLPFTITDNQGATSTEANLTINYSTSTVAVTGVVFEDVNYGGGVGRPYTTANTSASGFTTGSIRRAGAVVELYDSNGDYVTAATTDATGGYTFTVQPSSGYTVRVVNKTVTSVRTGYTSALVPVQTYNGTPTKVGGEYPSRTDAAANTTNATLASLTPTATGSPTAAESIAGFTTGTGLTFTGPDFGFNFDLVVNTNDAGQGSLRQFILNSNALGDEAKLAQSGSSQAATTAAATTALAAGLETSIFKIPNGTAAVAGQLAGLANQFTATATGTAATISVTSAALPTITGPKTVIDGGTQTSSTGNSNAYSLATLNAETTGPEIIIDLGYRASPAVAGFFSVSVNANDVQFLNLGIANSATTSEGITIQGNALRTLITNSTINNNDANITFTPSATPNASIITNNVIRNTRNSDNDGIELNGGNNNLTISYNQILRNGGNGIDFVGTGGANTGNTISYNNFVGNGTSTQAQSSGVALRSANSNNNTILLNQFTSNYGAGIVAVGATTGNVFSQNSFSSNGVGTNKRGTGSKESTGLAIDLTSGTDFNANANGDGVTLNDNGDADTGANGLLNFPVITSATTQGGNLVIKGFARAGSKIELYGVGATADPTGFGEGATYLTTVTEGVGDADASTNQSYSGIINRLDQGSDNSPNGANGFSFTIPLSSLPGVASGTLLSSTATLASNTSEFSGNVAVDAPFAQNVTNVTVASGPLALNPNLSGTANGTASGGGANTIASYTIVTLPALGTLTYVNAGVTTTVTANTNITAAQLATLKYTPVAGSTATQSFTYNVTDANGAISAMSRTGTGPTSFGDATYTIPVQDLTISGTVYNDVNGLTNGGTIDGTGAGTFGSANTQVYVNLINNATPFAVVASVPVAANGTYSFGTAQGVAANTTYRLYLSTTAGTVGSSTAGDATLALPPTGYGFTGEGTTATGDGTANGFFSLTVGPAPVSGLNFGLDFRPTGGTATLAATNPGGTTSVDVTSLFSGTDLDPNVTTPAGAITSVLITALPTRATSITINGATYTSTAALGAGVSLPTNANGTLASGQTVSIDPINGSGATVLTYSIADNGGLTGPGSITLNFTDLLISGTVYNDVNGLTNGSINGKPAGTFGSAATQAYVNLVNATTNNVVAVATPTAAPAANAGDYTFNNASGVTAGTAYKLVLSTTAGTVGSPVAALPPTGYGFVGEGTAATGDGTPDGVFSLGTVTVPVTGIKFGLDFLPTANTTSLTATNPGGTAQFSIAGTNFGGTDNDPSPQPPTTTSSIVSLTLTTFPTNATTVVINGVSYTSDTFATATAADRTVTFSTAGNFGTSQNVTVDPVDGAASAVVSVVLPYLVTDNGGLASATTGALTINFQSVADVTTTITGPAAVKGNVATTTTAFTAKFTNNGPSTATDVTRVITLPPGATLNAAQVTALPTGAVYTAPASTTTSGTINFGSLATLVSGSANAAVNTFGFVPYNGGSSPISTRSDVTATTGQGADAAANFATASSTEQFTPVPAYVTSPTIPSTAGPTAISPLTATDQDGTIASYRIQTLPPGTQGSLYVNNNDDGVSGSYVVLTTASSATLRTLTPAQAGTLKFDPTGSYAGNVTFTYTATDNDTNVSTTYKAGATFGQGRAVYTIPVTPSGISADNDSNVVPKNTATTGNVLLNDTNPATTGLAVAMAGSASASSTENGTTTTTTTVFTNGSATTPYGGTVKIAVDGSYTYTPKTDYTGPDRFAYQVCTAIATTKTCATALVSLLVYDPGTACTSSTGPNLLANPDFNSGKDDTEFGFATDYTYVASGGSLVPENTYAVTANARGYHNAFHGVGHANATNTIDRFMAVNGSASVQRIYSQTVTVQKNRYYTFSAFYNNLLLPGSNNGLPELGFVINGESTSGTLVITESPDRWVQFSDIWYSGSNTTATFEIRNRSTALGGNDFAIDDVYFGTCNLAPLAANDLNTTAPNTATTFIVSGSGTGSNDSDGDGYIDPATVDLNPSLTGVQTSYTDVSGNQFVLSTSGTGATATVSVVFTPATGFTGVASLPYVVKDNNGALSNPGTISVTVRPPATDVATTISASAPAVNAGATETITVQSLNNGPASAQNVQQSLYLPAGLGTVDLTSTVGTGATVAAGSPSYDNATGLVTFPAITSLANGSTVTWKAEFMAPVNGPFTATAAVASSTNQDPNTTNNTASTSVTVNPRFDLSTTISGPASITQNNLLTYTVTTRNAAGGSIAQNAAQTVTGLPTNLTQVFVSNGGTYNTNGTVTFLPLALAAGQTTSNTISFVATGAANSTITPTAAVTPNTDATGDIATANNSAFLNATATASSTTVTAPTTGPDQVNVYTTISTNATGPVAGGAAVTVNVAVGNYGPKTAAGVVATVTLQPGLTVMGLPGSASYDATTGIVTLAATSLTSAASQSYSFSFTAPTTGPVLLAAAASTSSLDVVPTDNVASTKVDLLPTADVATSLAGPTIATAGQPVTYSVTTLNKGVGAAAGVAQTVTLPVGLTATGLQLNGSLGTLNTGAGLITFADNSTYNPTTGVLSLPVLTSAPAGTTRVNSITFPAPVASGTLLVNADVSSFTADGVPTNNAARTSSTVQPSLDVVVTLSGPASALTFGAVAYSVTTTNNGPASASSVSRTLQLPTGLQGVVKPADATYNSTTGLVTFATLSDLASGASVTQTVSFTLPDVAQLTGLAAVSVGGTISDGNLDNNRASLTTSATTPTDPVADLSATVTAPVTSVVAGQPVTLTATFANGPISTSDRARNVRPVLALPAGLSGTVAVSNSGAYDAATGLVTWLVVPNLLASDSVGYAPLTYTVTLNAPGAGPLTATASVSSAVSDPDLSNNSLTLSLPVTSSVDVATYVTGPASATTGNTVAYAVATINNGPSAAANVVQTITLPAGVTSYSLNGGAPIAGSGKITILSLTAQQPGAAGAVTQTISFTSPGTAPSFDVKGDVTATGDLAITGNNTSTLTTAPTNRAPVALNVVNSLQAPEGNTATVAMPISNLVAKDADGDATITKYTVVALPPASQGKLYVWNGTTNTELTTANFTNLALNPTQAQNLRFAPVAAYVGNVFFQYTATDNGNSVANSVLASSPALYTLTVGKDNNSLYATTDVKGGAAKYMTKDVLAYVIDPNGSAYTSGGLVYKTAGTTDPAAPSYIKLGTSGIASTVQPTGAASGPAASGSYPANPTNVLPNGVSLDPATGLIYISDASQLVNYPAVKYYQINVITTDIYGGVNTTVAQFIIGANPLPVTLTAFTAQAVQNRDALLSWTTASEASNDHFEVERSLDGSTFVKIGQLAGHGTTTTSNAYSLTDAGIGAKATGTVYYRLRQVDLDGTSTYSTVRTVSFAKPTIVSLGLYPNPTSDQTGLDLSQLPATAMVQAQLLDATGRAVLSWTLSGGQVQPLDVHTLASGSYVLLVTGTQPDGSPLRQALRLTKE